MSWKAPSTQHADLGETSRPKLAEESTSHNESNNGTKMSGSKEQDELSDELLIKCKKTFVNFYRSQLPKEDDVAIQPFSTNNGQDWTALICIKGGEWLDMRGEGSSPSIAIDRLEKQLSNELEKVERKKGN